MTDVTLEHIVEIARRESTELHHFYVGVEHLFLALTRLTGGVTAEVLERYGALDSFLKRTAHEAFKPGQKQRRWPDFLVTPRAESILANARRTIENGLQPDRALFLAILDEGDSLPIRILEELEADVPALRDEVRHWTSVSQAVAPNVPIQIDDPDLHLTPEQERLLQAMFRDTTRVSVKQILQAGHSGHSGALVLMAQPVRHGLTGAPVAVKIDDRYAILHEKRRYDQWVKDMLPPTSARIIDDPTLPPDSALGGLKYTFIKQPDDDAPANLRDYALSHNPAEVEAFIRRALYEPFHPYWWGQSQTYRFQAWQEYELLLPPALIVEALPPEAVTPTARVLRPKGNWSRSESIGAGEIVILEKFIVQKVRAERKAVYLSAGTRDDADTRASRIEVRGMGDAAGELNYHRGQAIPVQVGRVIRTRADILQAQVQALEPDFDLLAADIPFNPPTMPGATLPNPLHSYARLLERWIDGRLSPIHGDLHTGNILIGPAGDAWLIDFEWTRQGHTLFDWATLEISLLIDLLVPQLEVRGQTWDICREAIYYLYELNATGKISDSTPPDLAGPLALIQGVRAIAGELLAVENRWSEYYAALALCAIRVPSWPNRPLTARRLMYLASALYIATLSAYETTSSDTDTLKTTSDGRLPAV